MKWRNVFTLLITMTVAACSAFSPPSMPSTQARYAQKTPFVAGVPIAFPDLTMTFIGWRTEEIPTATGQPLFFTYADFTVNAAGQEKNISWTSGTGDISPVVFGIHGHAYALELQQSVRLPATEQNLHNDHLVLWQEED